MSHASMLKARRQHQKNKKVIDGAARQAKRLAKLAAAGPAVKKVKVKKEKVPKEEKAPKEAKVKKEKGATEKVTKKAGGTGKKDAT